MSCKSKLINTTVNGTKEEELIEPKISMQFVRTHQKRMGI